MSPVSQIFSAFQRKKFAIACGFDVRLFVFSLIQELCPPDESGDMEINKGWRRNGEQKKKISLK